MKRVLKALLPSQAVLWLQRRRRRLPYRMTPVRRNWGIGAGTCIDRYYIEQFLAAHQDDIRGHVLEFLDDSYTRRYGGNKVTQVSVWSVEQNNPKATIVADLAHADHVPSHQFDCIIFTQVLQHMYEPRGAIAALYRLLKPGGVLLLTVGGIGQISYDPKVEPWGFCWRFTPKSVEKMVTERFPAELTRIRARGNVLAATAFLHGLVVQEMLPGDLDVDDPDYDVTITGRAMKPLSDSSPA